TQIIGSDAAFGSYGSVDVFYLRLLEWCLKGNERLGQI
ncbi:hypothetical protein JMJ77_0002703, partial [Colletotrichum scovillei]